MLRPAGCEAQIDSSLAAQTLHIHRGNRLEDPVHAIGGHVLDALIQQDPCLVLHRQRGAGAERGHHNIVPGGPVGVAVGLLGAKLLLHHALLEV